MSERGEASSETGERRDNGPEGTVRANLACRVYSQSFEADRQTSRCILTGSGVTA